MRGKCPECGDRIIKDPETGELYCEKCGLIIDEISIDPGREWRVFNPEDWKERSRVGPPNNWRLPNKGLGTSLVPKELKGERIGREVSPFLKKDKGLRLALLEIDRIASELKLPTEIKEEACALYQKARARGLLKGRKTEVIASALLYIVCREFGIPRTFKEIGKVAKVKNQEIYPTYRSLLSHQSELRIKTSILSPEQYIPRFCSVLGLNKEIEMNALAIAREVSKELIGKRNPIGIAGAAIHLAASIKGVRIKLKEIVKVTGVTEPTIRRMDKEIAGILKPLLFKN